MIAALRVCVAAWLDWLADLAHPNDPVPAAVLCDQLADAEADTEVWEPIGEYPDLPTSCRQPPG